MSVAMPAGYRLQMPIREHLLAGAALLAAGLCPAGAAAQAVVSTGRSFIEAELVAGARAPGEDRIAGLSLSLAEGWKTYWRSPGESGVPPVFDWSGSRNLASAEVLWPRPELFESFGFQTVGYSRAVMLPLRLVPEDPARPMEVRLKASLGVCRELCVLEEFELAERIDPGEAEAAARVARALDAVPDGPAESGLTAASCRIVGAGPERRFEARLSFAQPLSRPVVLVEGPETVWIGATETVAEGGDLTVSAPVEMLDSGAWIDRGDLRLTVLDGPFAADVRGCAAPG
ncbi:MAG TPA: protein-disulfide reductase DsbD domain-containing protein [Paracoccaceae bacterium]|nr:protein-disulfide reductase DsbD domain-containing protein [Paracoccaceae bacterium]